MASKKPKRMKTYEERIGYDTEPENLTVKAWAVVAGKGRDVSLGWHIAATEREAERVAFSRVAGWRVLRCTITIHAKGGKHG